MCDREIGSGPDVDPDGVRNQPETNSPKSNITDFLRLKREEGIEELRKNVDFKGLISNLLAFERFLFEIAEGGNRSSTATILINPVRLLEELKIICGGTEDESGSKTTVFVQDLSSYFLEHFFKELEELKKNKNKDFERLVFDQNIQSQSSELVKKIIWGIIRYHFEGFKENEIAHVEKLTSLLQLQPDLEQFKLELELDNETAGKPSSNHRSTRPQCILTTNIAATRSTILGWGINQPPTLPSNP